MEDMTQQDRGNVVQSKRSMKLGKAYQNYRRFAQKKLEDLQYLKIFFVAWKKEAQKRSAELSMEDLHWMEDDMDHFLHTTASFQTHKYHWLETRENRKDPSHKDYRKAMPMMILPSYVRCVQMTMSQEHSAKLQQHFGAARIDGTIHTPIIQLRSKEEVDLDIDPVASVAESAARTTKFSLWLFMQDTRLAIDSKTSFLAGQEAQDLVTQVQNYRGTKLAMFVMKRVKQMASDKFQNQMCLSPVQLRMGFEQIMGAARKNAGSVLMRRSQSARSGRLRIVRRVSGRGRSRSTRGGELSSRSDQSRLCSRQGGRLMLCSQGGCSFS